MIKISGNNSIDEEILHLSFDLHFLQNSLFSPSLILGLK